MLRVSRRFYEIGVICVLAGALAVSSTVAFAARVKLSDWEKIESERFGFLLAYPGNIFKPREGGATDEGHVLVSRDGAARLLVAAFDNDTSTTLGEYREQLLSENYSGAELDFAPVKDKWFIVSGTRGDMHFYERVSFTCGGKLINSWALLYPVAERQTYDRIVEAIARTYTPGAGRTGACD
ncbi:MAG: hypothetical protein WC807_14200 [Hyphomicrobium sp.]|jgi:hypothetical protein